MLQDCGSFQCFDVGSISVLLLFPFSSSRSLSLSLLSTNKWFYRWVQDGFPPPFTFFLLPSNTHRLSLSLIDNSEWSLVLCWIFDVLDTRSSSEIIQLMCCSSTGSIPPFIVHDGNLFCYHETPGETTSLRAIIYCHDIFCLPITGIRQGDSVLLLG
jgi:hypothetical protein